MATGELRRVLQTLGRATLHHEGAGLTDGQLLDNYVRSRDEAAFAALVRRHGPMVWGVCRRVLRSHHDAEDAFQATFLVLVRKAASVVSKELVANWLYGVAHQTALKARATAAKRRAREKQVTAMPEPAREQQALWDDLQPLLDQELSRLPDKYRAVIVLCELGGKTRKEAARHFHVPEGTVASRLATARALLAKRLTRHGLPVSGAALAAVLSQQGASAGVPLSVASSTIQAASLFAAGQAAAPGVLSVKAVALTEGVLKAMLLTKLRIATAVLVALAALGAGTAALTQQGLAEKPAEQPVVAPPVLGAGADVATRHVRGDQPADQPVKGKKEGETAIVVSGILKAVHFEKQTVTVAHQEGKDTFTVAKGATIMIDGKRGNLVGLPLGSVVGVNLLADHKTARSIHAERPQVSGVVKAVDAEKNTLTVEDTGAEKTYTVAEDAKVEVDGRRGTLAEMAPGARVTLGRVDLRTADSIQAYGPGFQGVVKAVDAEKNTLAVANRSGPPGPEKTLAVAKDAPIEIDGQRGKLAGLPTGAIVNLALSADLKTVRRMEACGPWWNHIPVKAVDAEKNTITFDDQGAGTFTNQPPPTELAGKTSPVAKDAGITIDDKPGKFSGVPPGALVHLSLSADQKTVRFIRAYGPGWSVIVKAVDAEKNTITVDDEQRSPSPQDGRRFAEVAGKTFPVAKDARIRIDGKPGKLGGLPPGARIDFGLSADRKTVRSFQTITPHVSGVVKAVDAEKSNITLADALSNLGLGRNLADGGEYTFSVPKDADIRIDDKPGKLSGVPPGVRVGLNLLADQKTVRNIHANGPGFQGVVVKAVDAEKNAITFDEDKAPAELAGKTFPMAKDASIQIDGKPGKLAGLPPGARSDVGLSVDQKAVRSIKADGSPVNGMVKAADAEKNTITIEDQEGEKIYAVAKDANIEIDGKPGKLSGVPPGARVAGGLSADQKTVRRIRADGPGWGGVVVKAVDAAKNTITFDDDKAPAELAGKTLPAAKDAGIRIDDKPGQLAGLPTGALVYLALSADQKMVRTIHAKGPGWTGVVVKAVDAAKNTITFDDDKAPPELAGKTFPVAKDADIMINGNRGRLAAVRAGVSVVLGLSVDRKTVRSIAVGP
jgi:RNA polymerase sigma factor (sigma-70 family)